MHDYGRHKSDQTDFIAVTLQPEISAPISTELRNRINKCVDFCSGSDRRIIPGYGNGSRDHRASSYPQIAKRLLITVISTIGTILGSYEEESRFNGFIPKS